MAPGPRGGGGNSVDCFPTTDNVSLAVEQSGEEPQLVSSRCSTVWTEKAPAEDTPRRECPHDVVGLRARKGTMWMSNDRVPLKNVESPYGGGVSSLPGAAGDPHPVMLAQKLKNHLSCWFLIMLTPLASMLLSRILRVCWSIHLHSRSRP